MIKTVPVFMLLRPSKILSLLPHLAHTSRLKHGLRLPDWQLLGNMLDYCRGRLRPPTAEISHVHTSCLQRYHQDKTLGSHSRQKANIAYHKLARTKK